MSRVYYWIYDLLLAAAFIIYLPIMLYKLLFKAEEKRAVLQRLGIFWKLKELFQEQPTIWVHAASVGETGAAAPLVAELREKFPDHEILFSTMTATGQEMAQKTIEAADHFIYFPIDFPWTMKEIMRRIQPELVVLMETELWPNFIKAAKDSGSKVLIASGRISDSSFGKYKLINPFTKQVLSKVDAFGMQSAKDEERIIELGAPEEKVYNYGNTKFDQDYGVTGDDIKEKIYQQFKLDPQQPILVAGSTHEGEEEQLLEVYQQLKQELPELVMLLAPRYIDRTEEIEELFAEAGIPTSRRSRIKRRDPEEESVIIVNTIGELAKLYGAADAVFVGGSLIERGGHNILEPAAQGKLVFFGPHMFNFKDSTELLLKEEVGVQVADKEELADKLLYYLSRPEKLAAKQQQARELIERNQGAAQQTAELARELTAEREILIVRLSAIGDVIHALPAAHSLREAYPEAQITWAVQEKAQDLVIGNSYLDQVIVVPKEDWKANFQDEKRQTIHQIRSFFADVRAENDFDLVLDLHGLFKSALTAYLSGADYRVGPADGREGSTLAYHRQIELPDEELHQVERNLQLAAAVGGQAEEPVFDFGISGEEKADIDALLAEYNLNQSLVVVINPFTTWESKNWPTEKYIQLADKLAAELGVNIVFTGGSTDREAVAELTAEMQERGVNLAGQTNLTELAELYRRAQLFIGGDTGPLHLAAALEVPVVALMGPTEPATHGPYGTEHEVLQAEVDCLGCWDRRCQREHQCMSQITVEAAVAASRQLLERDLDAEE